MSLAHLVLVFEREGCALRVLGCSSSFWFHDVKIVWSRLPKLHVSLLGIFGGLGLGKFESVAGVCAIFVNVVASGKKTFSRWARL
jgi:hypothetical protein